MSLIYKNIITKIDKLVPVKYIPIWNHPAGPKTVFFWVPLFKFCLVLAGITDLRRPVDQISIAQSSSLAVTGVIWSRYCVVITPKNYLLCGINAFITATQSIQLFRAISIELFSNIRLKRNIMSLIYKTVITRLDKIVPVRYNPLWNHTAGPKTVFFWAPLFKLGLVAAGISDLRRPASQLSVAQSASLAATGLIWSRYCLVIIPKNYALCSVNAFVAITQLIQLFRALRYQQSIQDNSNQHSANNQ